MSSCVVLGDEVEAFQAAGVEGRPFPAPVLVKKMISGQYGFLLEVSVPAGLVIPRHVHTHDSFLYIVSGTIRATVGESSRLVGPGGAVLHPAGMEHEAEVLEDSVWVEVKAPGEDTW